jgi:hypothetical protein
VETSGQDKGIAMTLVPGWKAEAVAERAIAAARAGAKVLVIRNTVKAAVAAWEAVQAAGGEVKPCCCTSPVAPPFITAVSRRKIGHSWMPPRSASCRPVRVGPMAA